jgi:hypothetical protein
MPETKGMLLTSYLSKSNHEHNETDLHVWPHVVSTNHFICQIYANMYILCVFVCDLFKVFKFSKEKYTSSMNASTLKYS